MNDRELEKDIQSEVLTHTRTAAHFPHYLHILFFVTVGRILIEMRVRFFSLACACPQVSVYCVYVCV